MRVEAFSPLPAGGTRRATSSSSVCAPKKAMVAGSGVGVIVLKRLSDALADGDRIEVSGLPDELMAQKEVSA